MADVYDQYGRKVGETRESSSPFGIFVLIGLVLLAAFIWAVFFAPGTFTAGSSRGKLRTSKILKTTSIRENSDPRSKSVFEIEKGQEIILYDTSGTRSPYYTIGGVRAKYYRVVDIEKIQWDNKIDEEWGWVWGGNIRIGGKYVPYED
jgi:hypothetical protein